MNRIQLSTYQLVPASQAQEDLDKLIEFKVFKKQFLKKIKNLDKKGFHEWADCFIIHDYVYKDKAQKKLPIIIWGKMTADWKTFLKGKDGLKRREKDTLQGECRLAKSEEGEEGTAKYKLEFRIIKGFGKPKILTKKVNKFLMPNEKGFSIVGAEDSKKLYQLTEETDKVIDKIIDKNPLTKSYNKLEIAYRKLVTIVAINPEEAAAKILVVMEQISTWFKNHEQLSEKAKERHQKEHDLIQAIEIKFQKLLDQVENSNEVIKQITDSDQEESSQDSIEEEEDSVEDSEVIDNTDLYDDEDDEMSANDIEVLPEEIIQKGGDFSDTKMDLVKLELAIKKLKSKGDLSVPQQQELDKLKEKAGQLKEARKAITVELYEHWKQTKGWKNSSPREILKSYDNNWFKIKEDLGYLEKENPNSDFYQVKLAALEQLLNYRQQVVDDLLEETKTYVFKVLKAKPNMEDFTKKEVVAFALGSTTPTSDYDVTFQIADYPQYEYLCVKYFNDTFVQRFGVNSGMLFDTNVYTAGFMPITGKDGKQEYKDKFNPLGSGKSSALPPEEKAVLTAAKRKKHQIELALSMSSVLQYIKTKKEEQTLKSETLNSVIKRIKAIKTEEVVWKEKTYSDAEVKLAITKEAREDMTQVFALAKNYVGEVNKGIETKKKELSENSPGTDSKHIEAQAKDLLYVECLENVSKILEKLEANKREIKKSKEAGENCVDLFAQRAALVLTFKKEQGVALMYANEAYFSGGAALHVVKGMQGGGELKLSRQEKMQSMLMNIGYQLQHFDEQAEEHGLGRAVLGTSKYGQRVANLTRRESEEEQGVQAGMKGIRRMSSVPMGNQLGDVQGGFDLNDFMDLQDDIIKECKKNDLDCPTPSSKDAAADQMLQTYMKGKDEEQIRANILETFLRSASRVFAPYYVEKYKENQARRKKGETDISPLSFW